MAILFNKKAKCQGCMALHTGKDADGKPVMACRLGFSVDFKVINGQAMQPKPEEKCYKPLTDEEFQQAKVASQNKAALKEQSELEDAKPLRSKDDYMTPLEAKYYR